MRTPDTFNDLTTDLRALGGGRVWSLMISLFGDLAQGQSDSIEGPVLSAIMAALDIKPEAARVALHRLRNDGWITSEKSGRISRHSLTPKGRSESAAASPRIYSTPDDGPENWQLILLATVDIALQNTLENQGFIAILPRVYVGASVLTAPRDAVAIQGNQAPLWLRKAITPNSLEDGYAKLARTLNTLAENLPDRALLTALDIAVLRCLVVHNWRRLVLKHTPPPRGLIDPEGAYRTCHTVVADLLARYPRPSLRDIAQERSAG